jgi:hypothetical protein
MNNAGEAIRGLGENANPGLTFALRLNASIGTIEDLGFASVLVFFWRKFNLVA